MYKLFKSLTSPVSSIGKYYLGNRIRKKAGFRLISTKLTMEENKAQFTVCVEGNIGCGKTTLLNYFSEFNDVEVLHEPVNKWTNLHNHNLLDLLYKDPERWAHVFQSYVQLTMIEQHLKPCFKHTKIIERSLHSARNCFVENLFRSGKMAEPEYCVYNDWYRLINQVFDCKVDLIVYLRTDPTILNERIKARKREEEQLIPFEYLQDLHNLHEEWLLQNAHKNSTPVLVIDANGTIPQIQIRETEEVMLKKIAFLCDISRSKMQSLYVKHMNQIMYGDKSVNSSVVSSPSKIKKHRHQISTAAAVN